MKPWMVKVLVACVVASLASLLAFGGAAMGAATTIKAKGSPGNYSWDPKSPHVPKGNKVRWKNTTSTSHRMSFYRKRWKGKTFSLPANGTFTKKPRRRGTYIYRCTIPGHSTLSNGNCSGMCGRFHVQ